MRSVSRVVMVVCILATLLVGAGGVAARPPVKDPGGGGGDGGGDFTSFSGIVSGEELLVSGYYDIYPIAGATVSARYWYHDGLKTYEKIDTVTTDSSGHYSLRLSKDNPYYDIIWSWGVTLKASKHDTTRGECFWTERYWNTRYVSHYFYLPRDTQVFVYDTLQFTETSAGTLKLSSFDYKDWTISQTVHALERQDPVAPWGEMYTWDLPWIEDYAYTVTIDVPRTGTAGQSIQHRSWFYATGQFSMGENLDTIIEGAAVYGGLVRSEWGDWETSYRSPSERNADNDFWVPASSSIPRKFSLSGTDTLNPGLCTVGFNSYMHRDTTAALTVSRDLGKDNVYYVELTASGGITGHWFGYYLEGTNGGTMNVHVWCVDAEHILPDDYLSATGGDRGWLGISGLWDFITYPQFDDLDVDASYDVSSNKASAEVYVGYWPTEISVYYYAWAVVWARYTPSESGTVSIQVPGTCYGRAVSRFTTSTFTCEVSVTDSVHFALCEEVVYYNKWVDWGTSWTTRRHGCDFAPTFTLDVTAGQTYYIEAYIKVTACDMLFGDCDIEGTVKFHYVTIMD